MPAPQPDASAITPLSPPKAVNGKGQRASDPGSSPLVAGAGPVTLLALVAGVLLFTRRPDQFMRPQFWAEDGAVFFQQAALDGWTCLWRPYHGYLHGVPRVVALACHGLPWEWTPAAYVLAAAAGTLYVVVRTAAARLPPTMAGFGAAAILAVPHNGEVWLNLCCFHFIAATLLAVNLLEPAPVTRAEQWRRAVEVVTAGLSGPEICLAAPFLLLRGWAWRRERFAVPVVLGGLAAAGVQMVALLSSAQQARIAAAGLPHHGFLPAALGCLQVFAPAGLPAAVVAGAAVGFVVLLALLTLGCPTAVRWRVLSLIAGALLVVLAARRMWNDWPSILIGTRFIYLGAVLVALAVGCVGAGARRPLARAGVGLLALILLAFSVRHWQSFLPADYRWADQVRAARAGRRSEFVIPPGWHFPVPRPPEPPAP